MDRRIRVLGEGVRLVDIINVVVAALGAVVIPLAGGFARLHSDVQMLKSRIADLNTVPERLVKIETLLELLIKKLGE